MANSVDPDQTPQNAGWVANSVDPDQMPHTAIYTVCSGLSVPILRVIMVTLSKLFYLLSDKGSTRIRSGSKFFPATIELSEEQNLSFFLRWTPFKKGFGLQESNHKSCIPYKIGNKITKCFKSPQNNFCYFCTKTYMYKYLVEMKLPQTRPYCAFNIFQKVVFAWRFTQKK